jgi:Icc-related predicted phosphoesterase
MRIAALSDQHGCMPEVPPCDLLLVAGDICPDRVRDTVAMFQPQVQSVWFDRMIRPWIAASPARHRIATWGNHDFCGQACDYSSDRPGRAPATTLQIVVDELTTVPSAASTGARDVTIWATPWSIAFGDWAFMKSAEQLAATYARIPAGIDVLMSHQPPYGYGDLVTDLSGDRAHVGSRELLAAIERVRPGIVVCGHIHAGHGRYEHQGVPIYNVSVVDERYRNVHEVTVIDLEV